MMDVVINAGVIVAEYRAIQYLIVPRLCLHGVARHGDLCAFGDAPH